MSGLTHTVGDCLARFVERAELEDLNLKNQYRLLKKAYFKQVLANHPDKGGDAEAFRETQAAFDVSFLFSVFSAFFFFPSLFPFLSP
jgi:hypothetical protein